MSEQALRKQLLLERVQANRETLRLEVDAVRGKLEVVRSLVKVGTGLLPGVGTVAATAAGAEGVSKAPAGGVDGLAALPPIVIAVAKLVIGLNQRPGPAEENGGEPAEQSAPVEPTSDRVLEETPAPQDDKHNGERDQ